MPDTNKFGEQISRRSFLRLGAVGISAAAALFLSACGGGEEEDDDEGEDD